MTAVAVGYPTPARPQEGAFLEQFVLAAARRGIVCTVIHPLQWHREVCARIPPLRHVCLVPRGRQMEVWRPRYWTIPLVGGRVRCLAQVNHWSFQLAVGRVLRQSGAMPDVLYGHFLFPSGGAAAHWGRRMDRPTFVGVGESVQGSGEQTLWSVAPVGLPRARRALQTVAGFIAVSDLLKRLLCQQLAIPKVKVGVFPNAVDLATFRSRDRAAARRQLGLPVDRFIVAYVGSFSERKGVNRVAEALSSLGLDAGAVYLGAGRAVPRGPHVLHAGAVPHDQVPDWLAAADVFVLPTLAEGCSNAILEAFACGLPVITSDREFNDGVVNDDVAIRVDPLDVGAIRAAITTLQEDAGLRTRMSAAARKHAQQFDIDQRVERILAWMADRISTPC